MKAGTASHSYIKEVFDKLKAQVAEPDNLAIVDYKPVIDFARIHYDRGHTKIQPSNFQAKVKAKLANGEKVIGFLSTNRLVKTSEGDEESWC